MALPLIIFSLVISTKAVHAGVSHIAPFYENQDANSIAHPIYSSEALNVGELEDDKDDHETIYTKVRDRKIASLHNSVNTKLYAKVETGSYGSPSYQSGLKKTFHAPITYDIGPIQVPLKEDGTPIDDENVAAVKASHLAAHTQQLARLQAYKYGYATAEQDAPIESPEVQYARFQHLVAQEQAKQLQYNPQLVKSVLPVDVPEVQIAKKEHEARVQYIRNRNAYTAYDTTKYSY